MCVSGLPVTNPNHAINMINAAFEIRDYVSTVSKERKANSKTFYDIRIGINSGPVVAGVVGT